MSEHIGIMIDSYTVSLILVIFTEIILLAPLKRDNAGWKWRWSNRITSTWKPAVYYTIIIVSFFVLQPILEELLENELDKFSYTFFLAPTALLIGFVWIWNIMIGKDMNRVMVIILIVSIIFFSIFLWGNLEFLKEISQRLIELNSS